MKSASLLFVVAITTALFLSGCTNAVPNTNHTASPVNSAEATSLPLKTDNPYQGEITVSTGDVMMENKNGSGTWYFGGISSFSGGASSQAVIHIIYFEGVRDYRYGNPMDFSYIVNYNGGTEIPLPLDVNKRKVVVRKVSYDNQITYEIKAAQ